jgi:uncharacterized membrane protein
MQAIRIFASLAYLVLAAGQLQAWQETKVDFVRDIKPIIESKCMGCHGPTKEEGFRIDKREKAMEYISAKDSANSELFTALIAEEEDVRMPPPAENNPLNPEQIKLVKDWIDQGAEWPEGVKFTEPPASAKPQEAESKDAGTVVADKTSEKVPEKQDQPASQVTSVAPEKQAAETNPPTRPAAVELTIGEKIWKALGYLHPAAVHLPAGLLLAAGLFSLLGLRGNFVVSDAAYCCLWLGALSAIFAAVVGWSASTNIGGPSDLSSLTQPDTKHYYHRISGVGVAIFSFLLALYAARARSQDPDDGVLWKLGAMLLAVATAYCGYEGGQITHKSSHYNYVYSVLEELTGWEIDGKPNNVEPTNSNPADEKGTKGKSSDTPGVGQTTGESTQDKAKAEIAD